MRPLTSFVITFGLVQNFNVLLMRPGCSQSSLASDRPWRILVPDTLYVLHNTSKLVIYRIRIRTVWSRRSESKKCGISWARKAQCPEVLSWCQTNALCVILQRPIDGWQQLFWQQSWLPLIKRLMDAISLRHWPYLRDMFCRCFVLECLRTFLSGSLLTTIRASVRFIARITSTPSTIAPWTAVGKYNICLF